VVLKIKDKNQKIKVTSMKNLTAIFLFLLVYSCGNRHREDSKSSDMFFDINFEEALSNKKEISLAKAASNVEYIRLETTDSCLVRSVVRYFFTDSLIFISNRDHILKFSRDGRFLKKIGNPGRGPGEIDLIRIMSVLPDQRLIVVQKNVQRQLLSFYFARDRHHFKAMYNDTVYFEGGIKINPEYFLNMGKYRLPEELRPERLGPEQIQKFQDNSGRYYFATVHEASGKVFLGAHCYGKSPSRYVLFDKSDQKGTLLVNKEGDSKGFINDWDGGPDFWPIGSVNDDQVFMPVNVMAFKEMIKDNAAGASVKYPDKQKQLTEMASGMDISDNPVVMVVTMKSK